MQSTAQIHFMGHKNFATVTCLPASAGIKQLPVSIQAWLRLAQWNVLHLQN